MKKTAVRLTFAIWIYLFIVSIGHSLYMHYMNTALEQTISDLTEQVLILTEHNHGENNDTTK